MGGGKADLSDSISAVYAFYAGLDRRDYDLVLDVIAPNAVWERHDGRFEGRAAISAVLDGRPANVLTAHMVFNPTVEMHDEKSAVVRFSLFVLAGDTNESPPTGKAHQVRQCEDRVSLIDGRWLITHRSSSLSFNIEG